MLKNLWIWILTNVFKVQSETNDKEIERNIKYAQEYANINSINFNAIFSNKLANYVANDSTMEIEGENKRAELLGMTGKSMWKKLKKITSISLGTGGAVIVPNVKGGKIYYDILPQDRLTIDKMDGDLIVGATILAEKKTVGNGEARKTYLRWTNYSIINNNLVITQQYSDDKSHQIPVPDFWKDIQEVKSITNVDRVPFGFIKSTVNNRKGKDNYGVPITYGCEETISQIRQCMKQIVDEYNYKEVMIAVDKTAVKNGKLSNLFTPIDFGSDDLWQVYDPAIRDSAYYNRLTSLYAQLEKEVGTSAGILTEINVKGATATAIKRSMYDTFTIVDDMRSSIEKGLEDFFYACNILANAYNISPMGEYEIKYDWDYSLLEDNQEIFTQLIQGLNNNVISKAELRNWLKPSETMEESEEAIKEIEQANPSIQSLLGTNNIGSEE